MVVVVSYTISAIDARYSKVTTPSVKSEVTSAICALQRCADENSTSVLQIVGIRQV